MEAMRKANQFRRPRQQRTVHMLVLLVVAAAGIFVWRSPNDANLPIVHSGSYRLVAVNSDASLTITVPGGEGQSSFDANIYWLGVEIDDPQATADWLRTQLTLGDEVAIRLDRRRLDQFGNLNAYMSKGDKLLNAELIHLGFGREVTHPADYAPIARQLRRAGSAAVAHN